MKNNNYIHRGFAGVSVGVETFTDFDFADDVAVLSEMLEILIPSLEIMHYEALPFGLEINWDKTKIHGSSSIAAIPLSVSVMGNSVELVESFTYLHCFIFVALQICNTCAELRVKIRCGCSENDNFKEVHFLALPTITGFLVLREVTVYLRFYWNLNYQLLILFYTTVVLFSGVLGANVPIYWCHVFVSYSCVFNCALILFSFLV